MQMDTRPEAPDVAAARVRQAVLMRGRVVARVVKEDQLVPLVSQVDVVGQAAGRVVDLRRARPLSRVSLRRLMPQARVIRALDPDGQPGSRVLVALAVHLPIGHQDRRAVHAVKESRVGKAARDLKETQESQDQALKATIGSQRDPRHMNLDWALRSPQEETVSRTSG